MFLGTKRRNEGTCGCSPVPKAATRVHSPKPPFHETALLSPVDNLCPLDKECAGNDTEKYFPRIFACDGQPHELHIQFRLSKCNFLTRNGLHEGHLRSRTRIPHYCVCNVFEGWGMAKKTWKNCHKTLRSRPQRLNLSEHKRNSATPKSL